MKRHPSSPILRREDVPDIDPVLTDVSSVFNPGALRFEGRDHLVLRVQARSRETFLVPAVSDDGVHFAVEPRVLTIRGLDRVGERVHHVYDARLSLLEGRVFLVFAADADDGCRLGIASSDDLRDFELISYERDRDTRNGVLFPEKIGGKYLRLERPNRLALDAGPTSGDTVVLSSSDDLVRWQIDQEVFRGRWRYWDERIGPGPPPIKTAHGWLLLYHGVATHFQSSNLYQAGAVLLDLRDPSKVLGRTRGNLLEPREPYELVGQVPGVVFPSGCIATEVDENGCASERSELRVYYGAADTCVGLAVTTVREVLGALRDPAELGA